MFIGSTLELLFTTPTIPVEANSIPIIKNGRTKAWVLRVDPHFQFKALNKMSTIPNDPIMDASKISPFNQWIV